MYHVLRINNNDIFVGEEHEVEEIAEFAISELHVRNVSKSLQESVNMVKGNNSILCDMSGEITTYGIGNTELLEAYINNRKLNWRCVNYQTSNTESLDTIIYKANKLLNTPVETIKESLTAW
jgi:hypothetical protein